MRLRVSSWLTIALAALVLAPSPSRADDAATRYRETIQPILEQSCYGCHAMGSKKGNVSLDEFPDDEAASHARDLWFAVLKNVRAGIMPPPGKPRPSADEVRTLEAWIKRDAFRVDPGDPDPGRVTLRRLNRIEYRNTIRDLMGIDFRTDEEFPADDQGYGFDNIGDVLSVSPLLLEKYLQAAETIVAKAVPAGGRSVKVRTLADPEFRGEDGIRGDRLSFYNEAKVAATLKADHDAHYRLAVDVVVDGTFDPEPGKCRLVFAVDDRVLMTEEYRWSDDQEYHYEFTEALRPGDHRLTFEVRPLVPRPAKSVKLDIKSVSVRAEGPLEKEHWSRPKNWERFFSMDDPGSPDARRAYARDVLGRFASRAFRRPVDARTLDRLSRLAEETYNRPGKTIEQGIGEAMVAVLASPRFLFRVESVEADAPGKISRPIDEYSLASRLSYFLWSTMPDEGLIGLAAKGELRKDLKAQVERMLRDPKSEALVQNFTGQWLEIRDLENFPIQARSILRQDGFPTKSDAEVFALRRLMKRETEQFFAHVVREDRSILEFLDSDYTFANEQLAKHYGIPGVTGREFRRVPLPEGSPRGGLLTQGGMLMITSNPNRTSPVKRGQFLLENFLGSPSPPPPPEIPALEESRKGIKDHEPTVREVMALHRADTLCASCHSRMDPLGLALENFNALGMWREVEKKQPIDASGQLLSGQSFHDARDLKKILKGDLRRDFYRCLTEKLLTYALGRGLEYYDVETVDQILERLDRRDGRFSALLMGIVESSAFQKKRNASSEPIASSPPNGAKP